MTICFLSNFCQATDSLQIFKLIKTSVNAPDTQRLRLYDEISWQAQKINNVLADSFARKGLELARGLEDSDMIHKFLFNEGTIKNVRGDYKQGIEQTEKALQYFQKNGNETIVIKILSELGTYYSRQGEYLIGDSLLQIVIAETKLRKDWLQFSDGLVDLGVSFIFQKKYPDAKKVLSDALVNSLKYKNNELLASIYMNLGIVEKNLGDSPKAIEHYLNSIRFNKKDNYLKALTYNNLGNIYNKINQLDKALEYHEASLKIKKILGLKNSIAVSLLNVGVIHKRQNNFGKALEYYYEALEIIEGLEGKSDALGNVLNNIGNVHNHLEEYSQAEKMFNKALKVYETDKNLKGICRVYHNLSILQRDLGNCEKAIEYSKKGFPIAHEGNWLNLLAIITELSAECYEILNDYEKAFEQTKLHLIYKDSFFNAEKAAAISELEKKFQKEQQEKEFALQTEKIKSFEQQEALFQTRSALAILVLMLLLLITGIIIYRQKVLLKNEKKLAQEKSKNANLQKNILQNKLAANQQQLDTYLKKMVERTELIEELKDYLETNRNLPAKNRPTEFPNLPNFLSEKIQSEQDWKDFEYYFSLIRKDFFKNFKKKHPNTTANELNLAALIKLNLINKEISKILGISPDSVRKAKNRLAKKLQLSGNEALESYIIKF